MIPVAPVPGLRAALGPRWAATLAAGAPRRVLRGVLFVAGLVLALAATFQPVPDGKERARTGPVLDVVLCLDVSRSMSAQDLAPDRLSLAQREIRALAARGQGERLGLVAYAGEARLVSPLTTDAASVVVLADLAASGAALRGGTDTGAALDTALGLLAGAEAGHAAIVLLTDGEDHEERAQAAARRCRARGVSVHALGIGTELGAKIPREAGDGFVRDGTGADVISRLEVANLARIAEAGGGTFTALPAGSLVDLVERTLVPRARGKDGADGAGHADLVGWLLLGAFALWLADLGLTRRAR